MILTLMLMAQGTNLDKNASNLKENETKVNPEKIKKKIREIADKEISKKAIDKAKALKASGETTTNWDPLGISGSALTKVWLPQTLHESLSSLLLNLIPNYQADVTEYSSMFTSRLPLTYPFLQKQDNVDTFESIQADFINFIKSKDNTWKELPKDYKYFGIFNNSKENLTEFLKNNPFFTSALKSKGRGYEIDSRDNKTWFGKSVQTLDSSYDRAHAVFDRNLNLRSITLYTKDGVKKSDQETEEKRCAKLTFMLLFYSQLVHGTIHVYHTLLTAGISQCSFNLKDSCSLKQWARSYLPNVLYKNEQVDSILLKEGGVFLGGNYRTDHAAVIQFGNDVITEWGKYRNSDDFIRKFILKDVRHLNRRKILTQFFKHASLVEDYARDLSHALRRSNSERNFRRAEFELRIFLPQCGRNVIKRIDSLKSWIEMMTITGILHGSTFSFTRLQMTTPIMKLNTTASTYGANDFSLMAVLTGGTLVGKFTDHSVFSENDIYLKDLSSNTVRRVFTKYNKKSEAFKRKYFREISRNSNRFNNFGWLYSDYFPFGYDGKQFTKTTYI